MKRITILLAAFMLLLSSCGKTPASAPVSPSQEGLPATVVSLHQPRAAAGSTFTPRVPFRTPTPDPTRVRPPQPAEVYLIQRGDTLGGVAYEYGTTPEELAALNGLTNLNAIKAGQPINVPIKVNRVGPANKLIPDSELVYGPAYVGFDTEAFVRTQKGYLKSYTEEVDKKIMTGAQIVQLVADRYSVGPRILLAMLEYQGGWLSNPTPDWQSILFPLGFGDQAYKGLLKQLARAADLLNDGYYGYKTRSYTTVRFQDGTRALFAQGLNAGTIGVQIMLARANDWEGWQQTLGPSGFAAAYQKLFGDPFAKSVEPLIPPSLKSPELRLPWAKGELWYYSGGPHGGWGNGSAWAAVDFIPPGIAGCYESDYWVTAIADGPVIRTDAGTVIQAIAGGDKEHVGWTILYLHIASSERVAAGTRLKTGDRIGHPSCEGGVSDGTHVHIARLYNGEWIAADGPLPMIFSGWQVHLTSMYDGTLTKGGVTKTACACRADDNAIVNDQ